MGFENKHPGGMSIRQREFLPTVDGKQKRWESGTHCSELLPTASSHILVSKISSQPTIN